GGCIRRARLWQLNQYEAAVAAVFCIEVYDGMAGRSRACEEVQTDIVALGCRSDHQELLQESRWLREVENFRITKDVNNLVRSVLTKYVIYQRECFCLPDTSVLVLEVLLAVQRPLAVLAFEEMHLTGSERLVHPLL